MPGWKPVCLCGYIRSVASTVLLTDHRNTVTAITKHTVSKVKPLITNLDFCIHDEIYFDIPQFNHNSRLPHFPGEKKFTKIEFSIWKGTKNQSFKTFSSILFFLYFPYFPYFPLRYTFPPLTSPFSSLPFPNFFVPYIRLSSLPHLTLPFPYFRSLNTLPRYPPVLPIISPTFPYFFYLPIPHFAIIPPTFPSTLFPHFHLFIPLTLPTSTPLFTLTSP